MRRPGRPSYLRAPAARKLAATARSSNPATIDLVFDQQADGTDLVNGLRLRWGIGYALSDRRTLPWTPDGRIAFWGGWAAGAARWQSRTSTGARPLPTS
jgi:hypothetical protein